MAMARAESWPLPPRYVEYRREEPVVPNFVINASLREGEEVPASCLLKAKGVVGKSPE
jgi:hypothetical protein